MNKNDNHKKRLNTQLPSNKVYIRDTKDNIKDVGEVLEFNDQHIYYDSRNLKRDITSDEKYVERMKKRPNLTHYVLENINVISPENRVVYECELRIVKVRRQDTLEEIDTTKDEEIDTTKDKDGISIEELLR